MNFPKLILCMSMFTVLFLTACGKSDDKAAVATAAATTCQAGYAHSASYGCLPQGYCPSGYVTYNNQCVAATQPTGDVCSSYYPGTQQDPNRPGWCTCLPGLRPQANGCY